MPTQPPGQQPKTKPDNYRCIPGSRPFFGREPGAHLAQLQIRPQEIRQGFEMHFNPSHPGEVLKDYVGDMTVQEAAKRLGVTRPNLSRILNGRAGISAVMSVHLAKAMPYTTPEFWLNCRRSGRFRIRWRRRLPRLNNRSAQAQTKSVASLASTSSRMPCGTLSSFLALRAARSIGRG
jgi:addiction module HigA family antidote